MGWGEKKDVIYVNKTGFALGVYRLVGLGKCKHIVYTNGRGGAIVAEHLLSCFAKWYSKCFRLQSTSYFEFSG